MRDADRLPRGGLCRWSLALLLVVVAMNLSACKVDWSDVFGSHHDSDNTADVDDTDVPGLNVAVSDYQFDPTEDNLEQAVDREDYYQTLKVDLADEASDAGEDIRPTHVILYEDPNRMTPLIAADRLAGLALPPAILVYQADDDDDDSDNVGVAYNNSDYLAARYDLADAEDALSGLADDQASLVSDAAGTAPSSTGDVTGISRHQGIVDRTSKQDFNDTLADLIDAIQDDDDLALLAQFDHRKAAHEIGSMLDANDDPATLVVFDAGKDQARLIAGGQTVGVDLPVRILVSEDTDGTVHVSYNKPSYLNDRHDLDTDNAVDDLTDTIQHLVNKAID